MTPSKLTGNFDVCIEVSEALLSGYVSSTFGGTLQEIPFNGVVVNGLSYSGKATLSIDTAGLTLDAAHNPNVVVSMAFSDSGISLTSATGTLNAMPLAGTVRVSVPVVFSKPVNNSTNLQLDFTKALTPVVTLDATSTANVNHALAQAGLSSLEGQVPTILNEVMQAALAAKLGTFVVPNASFVLVPGQNGILGPPPQFADLQLVTRQATPGLNPAVLCILGTILKSDLGEENKAAKTVTATDTVHQGSIVLSPDAVQGLLIAPAAGQLPAGLTLSATLLFDVIAIQVGGSITGTGYSIDVTVDAGLTLSLSGGVLTPHLNVTNQSVSVNLDWWVWLLGGAIEVGIIDAIGNAAANDLLKQLVAGFTQSVAGFHVPLGGAGTQFTLNVVHIQPAGIIVEGQAPIPAAAGTGTRVRGMVVDLQSEAPVQGATVTIDPLPGNDVQAVTNSDGVYEFDPSTVNFDALGNAAHTMTVAQSDYLTGTDTVTVAWGKTVEKDFALQRILDVTVYGHVLGNGAPVKGAQVALNYGQAPDPLGAGPAPVTVDSTGFYSIAATPDGDGYTLTVTAPGYPEQVRAIGSIANGGKDQEDFTLVAAHQFTVTGNVTCVYNSFNDTNVGNVKGAKVTVFSTTQQSPPLPSYTGQTDTNGNYTVGPVDPGQTYTGGYSVMVQATNLGSQTQKIQQPSGTSTEADFQFNKWMGPIPQPGTPPTPVGHGTVGM